jgi:hypothetical protein
LSPTGDDADVVANVKQAVDEHGDWEVDLTYTLDRCFACALKAADENGDRKIDLAEFLAVLSELPPVSASKAGGGGRPKKRFVP